MPDVTAIDTAPTTLEEARAQSLARLAEREEQIKADLRNSSSRDAIERAAAAFTKGRAALFGDDGKPLYVAAEHDRRATALMADLDKTIASVTERADAEIAAADAELAAVTTDPLASLSAEQIARANARAAFVAQDFEVLPPAELASRCRAALAGGDKVTMFLAERGARQRFERERAAIRMDDAGRAVGRMAEGAGELRDLADQLAARLIDPAGKRAAAEKKKSAAFDLKFKAAKARADVDGSATQAADSMRRFF